MRALLRPAIVTLAACAVVAASVLPGGAAQAGSAARQLAWKPTYLAHVGAGRILSATGPTDGAVWALGRLAGHVAAPVFR
jgi:hypothetical protein